MTDDALFDPKGLIRESFAIEGIGAPECRSIFLDWALGLPAGHDVRTEVASLLRTMVIARLPHTPCSKPCALLCKSRLRHGAGAGAWACLVRI